MAKCIMGVSVHLESVQIDDPVHVPKVGESVTIKIGKRTYTGIVISVVHDFTVENEHYIEVNAR